MQVPLRNESQDMWHWTIFITIQTKQESVYKKEWDEKEDMCVCVHVLELKR